MPANELQQMLYQSIDWSTTHSVETEKEERKTKPNEATNHNGARPKNKNYKM